MEVNNNLPTLVLICKRPALHHGKQRIAATLGPHSALDIANALLDCALEDANNWPGPVVIAPDKPEAHDWAAALLSRPNQVIPQGEGNLGERLNHIDHRLRQQGVTQTVYIGSDAPILSQALYQQARVQLVDSDIVLSPASDGGVTLMANARPWPELRPLPWSSETLGPALDELCRRQGLSVTAISPSYDIDNESDLLKLQQDIRSDKRPARCRLATVIHSTLEKKHHA